MKTHNLVKRLTVYCAGLLILALGVSSSVKSGLGVSANNSVPYAVHLATQIKMGTLSAAFFILLVAVQALMLRRDFKPISLLQFLTSILFGSFVNLTNHILSFLPEPAAYPLRLAYMGAAILLVAAGIFLYMGADLIPLAAEGLAAALAFKTGKPISKTKLVLDCFMVILAAAISLIFLGSLRAVREGTVLAALLIAPCLGLFMRWFGKRLETFLHGAQPAQKEALPAEQGRP